MPRNLADQITLHTITQRVSDDVEYPSRWEDNLITYQAYPANANKSKGTHRNLPRTPTHSNRWGYDPDDYDEAYLVHQHQGRLALPPRHDPLDVTKGRMLSLDSLVKEYLPDPLGAIQGYFGSEYKIHGFKDAYDMEDAVFDDDRYTVIPAADLDVLRWFFDANTRQLIDLEDECIILRRQHWNQATCDLMYEMSRQYYGMTPSEDKTEEELLETFCDILEDHIEDEFQEELKEETLDDQAREANEEALRQAETHAADIKH